MTPSLTLGCSRFEIASLLASRSFAQALTWASQCFNPDGSYRFRYRHRCLISASSAD